MPWGGLATQLEQALREFAYPVFGELPDHIQRMIRRSVDADEGMKRALADVEGASLPTLADLVKRVETLETVCWWQQQAIEHRSGGCVRDLVAPFAPTQETTDSVLPDGG